MIHIKHHNTFENVKLSLFLIIVCYALKIYGEWDIAPPLSTLVLDGGGWSVIHLDWFIPFPGKEAS